MNKRYVLTIDCGTQSLRSFIIDNHGNIVLQSKIPLTNYIKNNTGCVEARPNFFWDALVLSVGELKNQDNSLFRKIEGISVSSQRDTTILVDKNGDYLRNSISWIDDRVTNSAKKMKLKYELLKIIPSLNRIITAYSKTCHSHWIQDNEPQLWSETHKVLQVSTYLNYKLTGKYKDSIASTIGHIPFDYRHKKWDNGLKSEIFQIPKSKLYDLVNPCEKIGVIRDDISTLLGLPKNTPLIASGADKQCEIIGNACIDNTMGSISMGSQTTIMTTSYKYYELRPIVMPPFPSVIHNAFNPEIVIYKGFWMLKWFETEFAYEDMLEAKKLNMETIELLNRKMMTIPPGSEGLVLQPFWGKELLRPESRGSILGFSEGHTRIHLYRAIVEGLCFALKEGIELIEKKSKSKLEKIALSGGASLSDEICQIACDIFGKDVYRIHTPESTGLGAAMATFVGIGEYKDIKESIDSMVRIERTFTPNSKNTKLYRDIYNKSYKNIYRHLNSFYKKINL